MLLPRPLVRTLAHDGWIAAHPANAGARAEAESPALQVTVLGANKAARYRFTREHAVISIRDADAPEPPLADGYRAVLRLAFDDVSAFVSATRERTSISDQQADAVAAFVRAHHDCRVLVLHCGAGVSRSRSMAAAICEILHLPYRWTVVNPDVFHRVKDALLRAAADAV